jgi:2-keto-3-deoxy-L-rhamnonate aldolase RhmA
MSSLIPAWAREYVAHGFRLLAYGLDQALLGNALRRGLDTLRQ